MDTPEPLISIVTPVYNGESFLAECLDSVLSQSYENWECIIVNNCSTDGTAAIAARFCERDERFRVFETESLLTVIENHNFAVGRMSEQSRFCKILHADDFLFPDCLKEMAKVALMNPDAGVIGAYSLDGTRVRCDGLPYEKNLFSGREIGRLTLLGKIYPFWSPSSTMIRSDLVREKTPFYTPGYLHADVEAMYEFLQKHDFAFVHQILTFIRDHGGSETSQKVKPLNALVLSNFNLFVRYGPVFLTSEEFSWRLRQHKEKYHQFLAESALTGRNREFWRFHSEGLKNSGHSLNWLRIAGAIVRLPVCQPRFFVKTILQRLGMVKK